MTTSILYAIILSYATWTLYLAWVCLKRAKDANKLTKASLYLGFPILLVGYAVNFILNVSVFTLLFLELPKEDGASKRIQRHADGMDDGWRAKLARWLKANILGVV